MADPSVFRFAFYWNAGCKADPLGVLFYPVSWAYRRADIHKSVLRIYPDALVVQQFRSVYSLFAIFHSEARIAHGLRRGGACIQNQT